MTLEGFSVMFISVITVTAAFSWCVWTVLKPEKVKKDGTH